MTHFYRLAAFLGLFAQFSCQTIVPRKSLASFPLEIAIDTSSILQNSHSGILIKEVETGKVVYEKNAYKNFIPASNTKILSMYAALKHIPNPVPALKYMENDTAFFFWGTGDPSFLHRKFSGNKSFDFLKKQEKKLYYSPNNYYEPSFGKGWAWDDYNDDYQVEKSAFPIYGNSALFYKQKNNWFVDPPVITNTPFQFSQDYGIIIRDRFSNAFTIPLTGDNTKQEVPLVMYPEFTVALLSDTLGKSVNLSNLSCPSDAKILYSTDLDSLVKEMMERSDNFLAEQLLLMASSVLGDTLSTESIIGSLLENSFSSVLPRPRWVDGSGLSRYNLFSPNFLVAVMEEMVEKFGKERVYNLLAKNGEYGTLSSMHPTEETFIYGKSGSMSGVYNLTAFVETSSGKTLLVSIMHNGFTGSVSTYRNWTGDFLHKLKNWY